MADNFSELDSEGVYLGMSLEEFGIRIHRPGVSEMPRESLREAIEHLKGELASGDPLSAEERARLERVLGEVSTLVEPDSGESGSSSEDENAAVVELRDFTDRFEESHPELAIVLGRIMDSLSQLGF